LWKNWHVYDDFEFTKSKDFNPSKPKGFQGRANGAFPSEDNSEIQGMTQQQGTPSNIFDQLNKEQYAALVKQVARDLKIKQNNTAIGFNASAISGTVQKYSASCLTVFNSSTWIIDSGASEHMCFDSQFFTSLTSLPVPLHITLPNSFRIIVTHTGSVPILPNLTLHNVLFVPVFRYNLLSVNKLCTQYTCDLLFTPSCCILQGHLMKNN